MSEKTRNIKQSSLVQLMLGVLIIILVNIIGAYIFTRIDLTAEKRYSLSDQTKQILMELDDIVYFQVYLEGDFPAGFKRLRNATREMLDEFRAYSSNIEYKFINPSGSEDPEENNRTYNLLVERGLSPTDLQVKTSEGVSKKIIFPGAIASYRGEEKAVELLRSQMGISSEEVLNNSIQALEFNLANTIKQLTTEKRKRVAFIEGHGELSAVETADISRALKEYYSVDRLELNQQLNSLTERNPIDSMKTAIRNKYDAIIIAKPVGAFSEKDKFIIDQFIMRGGKVLWLLDPITTSMDSLQNSGATIGVTKDMNLEDMLFKYGVRLNHNLVQDLNAMPIPLTTGSIAGQPQVEFYPWYYFPVITPTSDHPIVKNLNAIKTEFISSLDTIGIPTVRKTILLKTSPYSRTVNAPVYINLNMLQKEPDERLYNKPPQPVAVLLEGMFPSLFARRIPPEIQTSKDIGFLTQTEKENRMIIMSDGDIIRNQLHYSQGYPLPLGYDQYTRETFGNKELILNSMNYLTDGPGLISIRSRDIKLRLLDMNKVNENKLFWQLLNVMAPILLILISGILILWFRKRKYTRNHTK